MLKRIPPVLSPSLFKIMMEMGHGDYIILADSNFPAGSFAQRLVRQDGVPLPELLDAMLQFFPLDTFVPDPVSLMQCGAGDVKPEIWATYEKIIRAHDDEKVFKDFRMIERFAFYDYAKNAYAIVQTGTSARYANIVLQKGVV
jgi:L-fucose mutarotase